MPMMWYGPGDGGAWLLGMLAMGIFWAVILGAGIWALTRWGFQLNTHRTIPPTALEMLQQRYARGEIDTATFLQMRNHLQGTANSQ